MSMPRLQTLTTVTVRYFAAARAAAGTDCERLDVPSGSSVDSLLAAISERHGAELARVLSRCSFLLDEVAVRDKGTGLPDCATVDVLPPFAGG